MEEEINTTPDNSEETVSHAYIDQERSGIIEYQLESNKILEDLENNLRGLVWSHDKNEFEQRRTPLLNENGINAVMGLITPRISKIIILSKLNEKDVYQMAEDFAHDIVEHLVKHYKEYELNKKKLSSVSLLLQHTVFATLKRAEDGLERKHIYTVERRVETHSDTKTPQNKKSFLGGLIR